MGPLACWHWDTAPCGFCPRRPHRALILYYRPPSPSVALGSCHTAHFFFQRPYSALILSYQPISQLVALRSRHTAGEHQRQWSSEGRSTVRVTMVVSCSRSTSERVWHPLCCDTLWTSSRLGMRCVQASGDGCLLAGKAREHHLQQMAW